MAAPRRWLLLAAGASASIHDLVVDRDRRALYRIESFCFVEGGVLELDGHFLELEPLHASNQAELPSQQVKLDVLKAELRWA